MAEATFGSYCDGGNRRGDLNAEAAEHAEKEKIFWAEGGLSCLAVGALCSPRLLRSIPPAAFKACAAAARERRTGNEIKADVKRVLADPGAFAADPVNGPLAEVLLKVEKRAETDRPRDEAIPYGGAKHMPLQSQSHEDL